MEQQGMNDKQFNLFLRMLLQSLKEAEKEVEKENKIDKLKVVIEDIQKIIED
ncbi:hypothetical protein [Finegoldia magna]|jgi:hypothetical protein|uniref:hypothetical protein n=1 Tax=Finegoldia magna TaxID=1260 RepID=UPI002909762D|nr:hypothetical protein [Finegoldia magna]MDU7331159.1 hypothetical protein [Finegoldia magna]